MLLLKDIQEKSCLYNTAKLSSSPFLCKLGEESVKAFTEILEIVVVLLTKDSIVFCVLILCSMIMSSEVQSKVGNSRETVSLHVPFFMFLTEFPGAQSRGVQFEVIQPILRWLFCLSLCIKYIQIYVDACSSVCLISKAAETVNSKTFSSKRVLKIQMCRKVFVLFVSLIVHFLNNIWEETLREELCKLR